MYVYIHYYNMLLYTNPLNWEILYKELFTSVRMLCSFETCRKKLYMYHIILIT